METQKKDQRLTIRRALLSVSDKSGIIDLGKALIEHGAEILASGGTAQVLRHAGLAVTDVESVTGNPEAFGGRMKTLSFKMSSGILYRRGNEQDEEDRKNLGILPIDAVVVNFYPFEDAKQKYENGQISVEELIEQIDIGGPTLVRAAAKNAPDVLTLMDPHDYRVIIEELLIQKGIQQETIVRCTQKAWSEVSHYDRVIGEVFGSHIPLKYGENPHQSAFFEIEKNSPIAWNAPLTDSALSYNNMLDISAGYELLNELQQWRPDDSSVVIVKHNQPCGVALFEGVSSEKQKEAFLRAWEGDPISAFGGVVLFSHPLGEETALLLRDQFIECVVAPGMDSETSSLKLLCEKRKNLKAVRINYFGSLEFAHQIRVVGGTLTQGRDQGMNESFVSQTQNSWNSKDDALGAFGVFVTRALKSNAIALVRSLEGGFQCVGAGQGQPNRVEALQKLAIPRAQAVLKKQTLEECILVSDAFFPFRDSIDFSASFGIKKIIQPGGSRKDQEVITACNEQGVAMAFSGVRHFRH